MTANLGKVNNIAKTAVVSGTATKGAEVWIGSQKTTASTSDGTWSMTVTGLKDGANELKAIQKINNVEIDNKTVTATIVDGGTLIGVDQGPIALNRGANTQVPFVVQNNELRANVDGTVTLTAPSGTTFASGQGTVQGAYRSGTSGNWNSSTSIPLTNGVLSNDYKTVTFNAKWSGNRGANEQYRFLINVNTPANAEAGTGNMNFTFTGDSSKGDFRATGKTSTTLAIATSPLTANLGKTNNIAKTAVVSGTATKGAEVWIGNQKTTASTSDGTWSMTVTGLKTGANELKAIQKINNVEIDNKTVTATIVDGGTLIGVDQGPIALNRDANTQVPFIVRNNEARSSVTGTVTVTAPAGTTFASGQATISGDWRNIGETGWRAGGTALNLKNGTLSNSNRTLTFATDWAASEKGAPQEYRYRINVNTPANAAAGNSQMGFTFAGDSSKGDFRATGKTSTTLDIATSPLTANVASVDNVAKSAVVTGTATKNADVFIGSQSVKANATTGAWSMTVTGLKNGANELTAIQKINNVEIDRKTVTATINTAVTPGLVRQVDKQPVTLQRDKNIPVPVAVEFTETTSTAPGTVTFTAPAGTGFQPGQDTLDAKFRFDGSSLWQNAPAGWNLSNGQLSPDRSQYTYTFAGTGQIITSGVDIKWAPKVSAYSNTEAGNRRLTFSMSGTMNNKFYATNGNINMTLNADLTASVSKTNNIAKTAVVSGTATKGAEVWIGDQKTTASTSDGTWSITVTGLKTGANELKAIQKINNVEIDNKAVTATIVDGGTLIGVDQGPIALNRGANTQVPFVVQNNELRANVDGTVTLTAPAGTTFASGQGTVQGAFRTGTSGSWDSSTSIPLTNGILSDNNTKLTFDAKWTGNRPAEQQYRFLINVNTPADAEAGTGNMNFTFTGDSSKGDFRATGKTSTTLETATRDLEAKVEKIDHAAGKVTVGGTATPGATIVIGDQSTEVAADGSWSLEVGDLKSGENELRVEQKIGDDVIDSKDLVVTINDAAVIGQDGPAVTLERGKTTKVETQFTTKGDVSRPDAKITFTAPAGTTFADGQDTIQGSYKKPGEDWTNRSVTLTDGDLSMDGKTYTFTFKPGTSTWTLPDASLLRWGIEVETPANAAVGEGTMSAKLVGTATEGSFNTTSTTATTITAGGPEAPSATGFFDADVDAWAGIRGTGAGNATIIVKNAAGEQIASTTANAAGNYTVRIDPNTVGFGVQQLTVTQTVNDKVSDGVQVSLDYGQNDPQFTSPTEGGTLPNKDFTLTGTGNAGGKIRVNGVDLRNDDQASIGSADVTNGQWSVRNTEITLPNGPYQFWANQRTKGGKIVFKGLNVTMEQAKPATPTANGYFPEDIAQWAGINGRGTVGATVVAKNTAGETIAQTTIVNADGSYNMGIDPNKVGDGVQQLTVSQTLNGATSDGVTVSLDYGYNTPTFTSPSESAVIGNRNLTFTGTGNTGGRLQINGVDLGTDDNARIGETTVTNDSWTIRNTEITLPTGFYQLWANQRTKGGKIAFTALNVQTVQAAPEAPTAVAFFGPTVETWGAISGTGEVGAEIIVRDADGKEITRTTITDPRGVYNVGIDPSKVGWGKQDFTVTQTVAGVPSKGIVVSLDYGQQSAPAITSPTFGQQIDGTSQITITGTGTTGSKLVVTGTDYTNDSAFGDTTVRDGRWSVTSTLDLPAGNYQFWASERTQGGKNTLTAVDVNITD